MILMIGLGVQPLLSPENRLELAKPTAMLPIQSFLQPPLYTLAGGVASGVDDKRGDQVSARLCFLLTFLPSSNGCGRGP